MLQEFWMTLQRIAWTYTDLLARWWAGITPEQYATLSILVALIGWWLMKKVY